MFDWLLHAMLQFSLRLHLIHLQNRIHIKHELLTFCFEFNSRCMNFTQPLKPNFGSLFEDQRCISMLSKPDRGSDLAGSEDQKSIAEIRSIVFGGGCFWCTEAVFQQVF